MKCFVYKFAYILILVHIKMNACDRMIEGYEESYIETTPVPIVLWHGVGDHCCNDFMNTVTNYLKQYIPGVYVLSLRIGATNMEDLSNGYFLDVNDHVAYACAQLAVGNKLAAGYNAIGFSQGAQFMRAVAQRCPYPRMKNFISLGGQHQGVYGIPHCSASDYKFCDYIRSLVSYGAYIPWVQKHFVQAQYWHDPMDEQTYKSSSIFLADINNENAKNETYRKNLAKLSNIVLVKFDNDTTVYPVITEWFGFFVPGQTKLTYSLEESDLYKEDWLGLQKLNADGKLHFLSMPRDHMQIDWIWFQENIVKRFLI